MSKRRKLNDNPYTLINEDNKYFVCFDNNKIPINKTLYDTFDRFELDDKKELNEFDRHIEHQELEDYELNNRLVDKPISIEEILEEKITNEELYNSLKELSNVQKKRIIMYYFDDLNYREISELESCSIQSVKESIDSGLKKLKKILNNTLKK